jgi:hypothetical protein
MHTLSRFGDFGYLCLKDSIYNLTYVAKLTINKVLNLSLVQVGNIKMSWILINFEQLDGLL